MLKTVKLAPRRFDDYAPIIDSRLFSEVRQSSLRLKGARILYINSTARGGGVAEILKSQVPLYNDLGINCEWQTLAGNPDFFEVTKMIHNGLQGDPTPLKLAQWELYQNFNRELARYIDERQWDFIVVHDPQPANVLAYCKRGHARWVWRNHIDSRHASPDFVARFAAYLEPYDGMILTLKKYLFAGLKPKRLAIIPVAIDPLSAKNTPMTSERARRLIAGFGIDTERPLAVQVSRFDPWKDPLGVIKAWQIAKRKIPDLQLALVGSSSVDDPQGILISHQVQKTAKYLKDIFIIVNEATDRQVHALIQGADVVIQKSLREGFGLTVSEALWAGTPVIGGRVGGIAVQIKNGKNGYLVNNVAQTAQRLAQLVGNPLRAQRMGVWGHEYVRRHFLLPRLIRDELNFLARL